MHVYLLQAACRGMLGPAAKYRTATVPPTLPTSAPGPGSPLPTSTPGPGSPLPHLHRDWARRCPHLRRDWGLQRVESPDCGDCAGAVHVVHVARAWGQRRASRIRLEREICKVPVPSICEYLRQGASAPESGARPHLRRDYGAPLPTSAPGLRTETAPAAAHVRSDGAVRATVRRQRSDGLRG